MLEPYCSTSKNTYTGMLYSSPHGFKDNKSLSSILWIQMHENSKKKIPDCLADSCKLSSVNWVTQFFLFRLLFTHTLYTLKVDLNILGLCIRSSGIQALPLSSTSILYFNSEILPCFVSYLYICSKPFQYISCARLNKST